LYSACSVYVLVCSVQKTVSRVQVKFLDKIVLLTLAIFCLNQGSGGVLCDQLILLILDCDFLQLRLLSHEFQNTVFQVMQIF
jgi:hypothetical protein